MSAFHQTVPFKPCHADRAYQKRTGRFRAEKQFVGNRPTPATSTGLTFFCSWLIVQLCRIAIAKSQTTAGMEMITNRPVRLRVAKALSLPFQANFLPSHTRFHGIFTGKTDRLRISH